MVAREISEQRTLYTSKKWIPIYTNPHDFLQVSSFVYSVASCQVFLSFSDPATMELLPDVACRSKRPRLGVRQSLHLTHADKDAKKRFNGRLENLRHLLTPGSKDNLGLMSKLMEIAEEHCMRCSQGTETTTTVTSTFLKSAGKFKDKILI